MASWDYPGHAGFIRTLAVVILPIQFVFWVILGPGIGMHEALGARMLASLPALALIRFPLDGKPSTVERLCVELTAFLNLGVFVWLALANGLTTYWTSSLVFISLLYGLVARPLGALIGAPVAALGASLAFELLGPGLAPELAPAALLHAVPPATTLAFAVFLHISRDISVWRLEAYQEADQAHARIIAHLLGISSEVQLQEGLDGVLSTVLARLGTVLPQRDLVVVLSPEGRPPVSAAVLVGDRRDRAAVVRQLETIPCSARDQLEPLAAEALDGALGGGWRGYGAVIQVHGADRGTPLRFAFHGPPEEPRRERELRVFLEVIVGLCKTRLQAQELERKATTDPLTGSGNRAALEAALAAFGPGTRFAVIYADVNGLKRINDTYGHHDGDALIQGASDLLRRCSRRADRLFRAGGDEFVLLCPDAGRADVDAIIDRIRGAMPDQAIVCRGHDGAPRREPVSISVGGAASDEAAGVAAVELADSRMVADKTRHYAATGRVRRT